MCVPPLAAQSAAPPDAQPTLSGTYECEGIGADGRSYRGAVIIEPDSNRFLPRAFTEDVLLR